MIRIGAVSAHFRRDIEFDLHRLGDIAEQAREQEVQLLVLPHGVLGGYHDSLDVTADGAPKPDGAPQPDGSPVSDLPPPLALDGPEVAQLLAASRGLTMVCGLTEQVGGCRANTAVLAVDGELVATHRKVHLPVGEQAHYVAGDCFAAHDTPVGRVGMMVDYDKTFPESARALAVDGAAVIAVPSAWPASRTGRADVLTHDRQRRMFDLYDQARAAENQVVVVSANQTGRHGQLQFFGGSKVVLPDGDIVANAGTRPGFVTAEVDIESTVERSRRRFYHLAERQHGAYRPAVREGEAIS